MANVPILMHFVFFLFASKRVDVGKQRRRLSVMSDNKLIEGVESMAVADKDDKTVSETGVVVP